MIQVKEFLYWGMGKIWKWNPAIAEKNYWHESKIAQIEQCLMGQNHWKDKSAKYGILHGLALKLDSSYIYL